MKSKRLLQIFVLLMLVLSSFGSGQNVSAGPNSVAVLGDAMIINRDLNIWDATYVGFVSDSLFEKWRFEFSEAHSFVINASPITGGLASTTLWWNLN